MSGEAAFYGLQPVDSDLHAFAAHQSLLKAYEKLPARQSSILGNKSNSLRNVGLMIGLSYITGRF